MTSPELKTRARNWNSDELAALINGYKSRQLIIDGKFGPTLTADKKAKAWAEITAEVNAASLGGRSTGQVKKQLIDQKTKVRAKASKHRLERQMTGGGPNNAPQLMPLEESLLSTMNPQTINGIIEDGDTETISDITIIDNTSTIATNYSSNRTTKIRDDQSHNILSENKEKTDSEFEIFKNFKKRKHQVNEDRVTSAHAESVLEIEREKVAIAREMVALKRIKLSANLRVLAAQNFDINEDIKSFNELYNTK